MQHPVERQLIHRGAKFDFESVSVRTRDGSIVRREIVRHPGAVVILSILRPPESDRAALLLFIRNYRISLDRRLLELPAGTLEKGEEPLHCAARELEEETGFRAALIEPLGTFYTTPGMTDELMHAFVARGLSIVGQRLEADEQIEPIALDAREAFASMDRGELRDGKSMLTLLLAARRGLLGPVEGLGGAD